jgi:hypothetical protein
MSLELGRSSAAGDNDDDDSEATEADDFSAENHASGERGERTENGAPRRSVLAPFMIASNDDDSPPEEASGDPEGVPGDLEDDEASVDAASDAGEDDAGEDDTGEDEAPQRGDTGSPAASDAGSLDEDATTGAGGAGSSLAEVDGPLLEDAEGLRTNWLRLQAGFVDDPHEAVSDAADLVEHTAQALVGALRQRQQKLREMWDGGRPNGTGPANADGDSRGAHPAAADTTEQLRLLMKRYRVLFNHICKS